MPKGFSRREVYHETGGFVNDSDSQEHCRSSAARASDRHWFPARRRRWRRLTARRPLTRADLGEGRELLFLARHGAGHTLPPHRINHRANIAALRELGADAVFATAAVGSLRAEIAPGDFVVLDDFLDFTKGEVVTFFDRARPGAAHGFFAAL